MKSLVLFFTLMASATACAQSKPQPRFRGEDVTAEFLKTYTGTFKESEWNENFVIAPNGEVSRVMLRQVGRSESKTVPYPTSCSYRYVGKIQVEKRLTEDRARYIDFATHTIYFDVSKAELVTPLKNGETNDANCANFIAETNAEIARRGYGYTYSYETELLDKNTFRIQTAGGGDYREGGPRTESTLDEIYVRQ